MITYQRRALNRAELALLFPVEDDQMISVWRNKVSAALFTLMTSTGIRQSEVLALTWADVDFANGLLKVNKWLVTYGAIRFPLNGECRILPLSVLAIHWLKLYQEEVHNFDPQALVFDGLKSVRLRRWFQEGVAKAFGAESTTFMSPHVLRQTWSAMLIC